MTATDEEQESGVLVMPRKKRDDQTVKIDRTVADKAGIVAGRRRDGDGKPLTLAEYLTELLRPLVERDYRDTIRQLNAEITEPFTEPKRRTRQ
jgi:hypothetical protein